MDEGLKIKLKLKKPFDSLILILIFSRKVILLVLLGFLILINL